MKSLILSLTMYNFIIKIIIAGLNVISKRMLYHITHSCDPQRTLSEYVLYTTIVTVTLMSIWRQWNWFPYEVHGFWSTMSVRSLCGWVPHPRYLHLTSVHFQHFWPAYSCPCQLTDNWIWHTVIFLPIFLCLDNLEGEVGKSRFEMLANNLLPKMK